MTVSPLPWIPMYYVFIFFVYIYISAAHGRSEVGHICVLRIKQISARHADIGVRCLLRIVSTLDVQHACASSLGVLPGCTLNYSISQLRAMANMFPISRAAESVVHLRAARKLDGVPPPPLRAVWV